MKSEGLLLVSPQEAPPTQPGQDGRRLVGIDPQLLGHGGSRPQAVFAAQQQERVHVSGAVEMMFDQVLDRSGEFIPRQGQLRGTRLIGCGRPVGHYPVASPVDGAGRPPASQ